MLTQISPDILRHLFAAARDFQDAAPWQHLSDEDIFGITDPNTGVNHYVSIMGQAGNYFALALYRGKTGFKSLLALQSEEETGDPEADLYEQDCLIASLETKDEIDPEDLALIQGIRIPTDGYDRHPAFRSYKPGLMPWAIDADEANLLVDALQLAVTAAHAQAEAIGEGTHYFIPEDEADSGKMRFFIHENGEWQASWKKPDSTLDFKPIKVEARPDTIEGAQNLQKQEAYWLVERFHFREPAMDDTVDRPYFPVAFALLDLNSQQLLALNAVHPYFLTRDTSEMLIAMFREIGHLPSDLVVSQKDNYTLLKPLTSALNITLHLEPEADMLIPIKTEIYRQMEADQN